MDLHTKLDKHLVSGLTKIVKGLMQCYNIKHHPEPYIKHRLGLAFQENRVIRIPKTINTFFKFFICLHEIGHIDNYDRFNFVRKFDPKYYYKDEYYAELFAIKIAKSIKIPDDIMEMYNEEAKAYVLQVFLKGVDDKVYKKRHMATNIKKWIYQKN